MSLTDRTFDEALAGLASFPLLDALYGRRSRRFPLGGEIPDGPLAYRSAHEHVPLSELETLLILTRHGRHHRLALRDHAPRALRAALRQLQRRRGGPHVPVGGRLPHRRAVLHRRLRARTSSRPATPARSSIPAVEELTPELMVERHRDRDREALRRAAPPAPRQEPYMEGHNTWIANEPGSLLVIPVADIAQHHIANLCFFTQNGYCIYDDVNERPIPGIERFAAGRHRRAAAADVRRAVLADRGDRRADGVELQRDAAAAGHGPRRLDRSTASST